MKRDKASISALERVSDELTASPDGLKVPKSDIAPFDLAPDITKRSMNTFDRFGATWIRVILLRNQGY
jgi:hypothetical protein